MSESKRQINYKYFSYLFFVLFVGSCVFNLIQSRLHVEEIEQMNYFTQLLASASKIEKGMKYEEVIRIVGSAPDTEGELYGEKALWWSPLYRHGALTEYIYQQSPVGVYVLTVKLDSNNQVTEVIGE